MTEPGGEVVRAQAPERAELMRRAEIRLQLAAGYYSQGQMATALEEANLALQLVPDYVDALSVRALVHMELGQAQQAEEDFLRGLRLQPENPGLQNNYGWFLCQNGREQESIAWFEKALNNPQYRSPATALSNAGECSTRLQKYEDAKRYLTSAHDHDPMQPETNTRIARLYYRLGELSQARSYLNIALRSENPSAQALWLGLNLERKSGDSVTAASLGAQLRRRHPTSREYAALLRGEFDE